MMQDCNARTFGELQRKAMTQAQTIDMTWKRVLALGTDCRGCSNLSIAMGSQSYTLAHCTILPSARPSRASQRVRWLGPSTNNRSQHGSGESEGPWQCYPPRYPSPPALSCSMRR